MGKKLATSLKYCLLYKLSTRYILSIYPWNDAKIYIKDVEDVDMANFASYKDNSTDKGPSSIDRQQ